MLTLQNIKCALGLNTTAVATNATSGTAFDTTGYNEMTILVHLGVGGATNPPSVLQIEQSETTDATNYSAISGYTGGTNSAGGFTISNQSTDAATIVSYKFDLTKGTAWTKPWVRPQIRMAGATATVTCIALLSRSDTAPTSATECGVTVLVTPS